MPTHLSAVDSIAPALGQTKRQLFAPFRMRRWARLAVVCLIIGDFAGGGGGGPSGNFNLPGSRPRGGHGAGSIPHVDWSKIVPWLPWIFAGIALVLLFILLWIYIASVFRFVLLDSVLYDRCELKGSWGRWERYGRSFFLWCLSLFGVFLVGDIVLVGAPLFLAWRAGLFRHPGQHLAVLILGGVALFLLLFAFFALGAIANLFAKDFCIPIMAMEKVGVLDAWRRLLPMLGAEKLAYTFYVLMKIVLAIGCAIIFGIVTIISLVVVVIILGIAALILFLGGKAMGLTLSPAIIILLVVSGGVIATGILYLLALISTPPMVFFQSYALHFFGPRYPTLGGVLFPPPPETPPIGQSGDPMIGGSGDPAIG